MGLTKLNNEDWDIPKPEWSKKPPPVRNSTALVPSKSAPIEVHMDFPGDELQPEDMSIEQLLTLRQRVQAALSKKLAEMGMQLKDTARATFVPIADPFWDDVLEGLVSIGISPRKAKSIVNQLKASNKSYRNEAEAISDAVILSQRK